MERFLQGTASILVAVILWIILSKQSKEYALIVSIGACCLVLVLMFRFLEPIIDLLNQLQSLGSLQPEWLSIMLKAVGIGLVVEMGSLICTDAGNASMAKVLQILGSVVVLWLSIPVMNSLMDLLKDILGGV